MGVKALTDLTPGVARKAADVDRHEVAGVGAVVTVDARRRREEGVDVAAPVERHGSAAHPWQLPGNGDPAGFKQGRQKLLVEDDVALDQQERLVDQATRKPERVDVVGGLEARADDVLNGDTAET